MDALPWIPNTKKGSFLRQDNNQDREEGQSGGLMHTHTHSHTHTHTHTHTHKQMGQQIKKAKKCDEGGEREGGVNRSENIKRMQ